MARPCLDGFLAESSATGIPVVQHIAPVVIRQQISKTERDAAVKAPTCLSRRADYRGWFATAQFFDGYKSNTFSFNMVVGAEMTIPPTQARAFHVTTSLQYHFSGAC